MQLISVYILLLFDYEKKTQLFSPCTNVHASIRPPRQPNETKQLTGWKKIPTALGLLNKILCA